MNEIETPVAWILPENTRARRRTDRPEHLRQEGFMEAFDALTVVYDCFRTSDPARVMLLGPPLKTMPAVLRSLAIAGSPSGRALRFEVRHRERMYEITVEAPATDSALRLRCDAGETTLAIGDNLSRQFRGLRVLYTLSKDNDFRWICDWMRFHRDIHGADAVLLYDNASTRYAPADLLREMRKVGGFSAIAVVDWPFPYGPQGFRGRHWDSNFCQNGAMEDARWRFLGEAQSVLNCDIDELVLTQSGSIFDRALAARRGYVSFAGRWVLPPLERAADPPVHRESTIQVGEEWRWAGYRLRDTYRCAPKWAVAPAHCPPSAQWSVHAIHGMPARKAAMAEMSFRHFRQIGTNWKYDRTSRELYAKRNSVDGTLIDTFARVDWTR
jgi:hypothetical protein